MYRIVRLLLGCIFFYVALLLIKKYKKINEYIVGNTAIATVIIVVLLSFLPFENLFITFKSPETAYRYIYSDKTNVTLVAEGESCDFVVGNDKDSEECLIIPKTADGWKTCRKIDTYRILHKIHGGILVYFYRYKSTDEFFVSVLNTTENQINVSDSCNSQFFPLESELNALKRPLVTYYAYINEPSSDYTIFVNGEQIKFSFLIKEGKIYSVS
ncbi:MAG: hypothetical protein E7573_09240 [Ruminococcaceae bacterium]|nr:hypothetical protein [Oscillospiraceae bacterium]MBR2922227.1 hypothetical protein [Alphaproteobacteria bacterium]MBR3918973.1 hypothetical protein [Clostridia bacterium]